MAVQDANHLLNHGINKVGPIGNLSHLILLQVVVQEDVLPAVQGRFAQPAGPARPHSM